MTPKEKNTSVKIETNDSELEPNEDVKESLRLIEDLKFFLATAPANWQENQVIRRYYLNHDEGFVSCIFWNNLYFVTGTDIVRCIVYKFQHFGRKITDRKKFEEGIFSDLRNLKCGVDAVLESPKSEFLEFLYKNSCLRTQKKQKVFFWFNVPHDKLMADALERDIKKEKMGQNPTTEAHKEPALSFKYDEDKFLFTQLTEHIERQKSLNESAGDSTSTADDNSIEYSGTDVDKDDFGFLNQDTPAQYRAHSDYEDDFPLDYFHPNDDTYKDNNDYIKLDINPRLQFANTIEENHDGLFEPLPSSYIIPTPSANQLVHTDEYLIEQTQPLKTPIPPLSSTGYLPKSAKFQTTRVPSSNDEFFPQSYQLPSFSTKFQTPLPRPMPSLFYNEPIIIPQPQHLSGMYHPDYSYMHPEPEYWPNPIYEQVMPYHNQQPGYMFLNDEMAQINDPYQAMNPAMINNVPPNINSRSINPANFASASSRQLAISANMMKKKSQMYQQQQRDMSARLSNNPISKSSEKRKINTDLNLKNIMSSRSTRVVNFKKDVEDKGSDNENFIPTPESSITHSEQSQASQNANGN
jgi:transcription factor STE12